jgi:crossover junction endodeoxyribonuclease RuvC
MKILGIDPSINRTGWGIISVKEGKLSHLDHGVIKTPIKATTENKLAFICDEIIEVLSEC